MNTVRAVVRTLGSLFGRLGRGGHEGGSSRHFSPEGSIVSGHEQLIRQILSTIHNNSILLRGGSKTGKTSLLLHLKERLSTGGDPATDFFPVYIDLHDVPERLLFATIANAVTEQLGPMPASRAASFGTDYGHRDLANDFRSVLRALRKHSTGQARLVLLINGIDELNHYAPRTAQRVRSLFMASLDGSLVMVASAVEIDRHWEQEGSPWYNFFEEIEFPQANRLKTGPG